MKTIYQVYVYSTGKQFFFSTKSKANDFVKDFYQEYCSFEGKQNAVSLKQFKDQEGVEIHKVELDL